MGITGIGRNALVLLSLAFLLSCKEPRSWVKEGPLFAGPAIPPSGKALVYIYWPAASPGTAKRVWVSPANQFNDEIRRGGYTEVAVPPGSTSFSASLNWDLTILSMAWVSQEGGEVKLDVQANQVLYLRIEEGTRFGTIHFDFQEVELGTAASEIRKCRRMDSLLLYKRTKSSATKTPEASMTGQPRT